MKKLLLFILLTINSVGFAQSTDLDREKFSVSYVDLPNIPTLDDSKRTYSINLGGIPIEGFTRVKSGGTIDIKYLFLGTTMGEMSIKERKHEKTNDDGEVISVSYTYKVRSKFFSKASINVINAATGKNYSKTFNTSTDYESSSFDSHYKAERHYRNNKYDIKNHNRSKHKQSIKRQLIPYLNEVYGYVPYRNNNEYLWILDSKKHPEYKKHHEAYNIVKNAFSKMKYDEATDGIAKELEPAISYFEGVIPRYPGTKRRMRKLKYASYYNLANIYYYLDKPEKVREYANKIIDNSYDKFDGKRFSDNADYLAKSLQDNQMNSRHMKVVTEDVSNIIEEEEDTEKVKEVSNIELEKAYLVTKTNDTILVDIRKDDVLKIAKDVAVVSYDADGVALGTKKQKASTLKELLFVEGLHYKTVKFKESVSKKAGIKISKTATSKLCEVLFESEKIGLYKYKGKELVLLTKGSEKGISTSSIGFVFGFNKKLAKIAGDCLSVIEKTKRKAYKNKEESLIKYCEDLSKCK